MSQEEIMTKEADKVTTKTNDKEEYSKVFYIFSIFLVGLIIFLIGGFIGFYGRDVLDSPPAPVINSDKTTNQDKDLDGDEANKPDEDLIEDEIRNTDTNELTCVNPLSDQVNSYIISTEILDTEEVTISDDGCMYSVSNENYTFTLEPVYEGAGYMYESLDEIQSYQAVATPNLEVDFLDSYTEETVMRVKDVNDLKNYRYESYFSVGEENCTQWQGETPAVACGVSGITLVDQFSISVNCDSNEEFVVNCDQLIESLSVEKI